MKIVQLIGDEWKERIQREYIGKVSSIISSESQVALKGPGYFLNIYVIYQGRARDVSAIALHCLQDCSSGPPFSIAFPVPALNKLTFLNLSIGCLIRQVLICQTNNHSINKLSIVRVTTCQVH